MCSYCRFGLEKQNKTDVMKGGAGMTVKQVAHWLLQFLLRLQMGGNSMDPLPNLRNDMWNSVLFVMVLMLQPH